MNIDIPSNNLPFQLDVKVESEGNVPVRVIALDPYKPSTKYYDFGGNVNGDKIFNLRFPVSPKLMKLVIFNMENGDMPYGDDNSFKVSDVKVKKLKTYDVWWNQDTKNFYNFAVEFAENAGILTSGDKKPHMYRSDDGKFTIDYYDMIYDKVEKKVLSTPARIGHTSGIIEVSSVKFKDYTVPMRLVILMHEFAHKYLNPKSKKPIGYETGADIHGLYIYLGKGWSPIEAHRAFLRVFENSKSKANHKRYKILRDFIDKFEKGKITTAISG